MDKINNNQVKFKYELNITWLIRLDFLFIFEKKLNFLDIPGERAPLSV